MSTRMEQPSRGRAPRIAAFAVFALLAVCLPGGASAQWTTSGNLTTTPNNVGINTTAPEATLHVNGWVRTTGSLAGFNFRNRESTASADDWVWYSSGNVARLWRSDAGDLLGITQSGNFGIGTMSPAARLDVNGAANVWSGSRIAVPSGYMAAGSLTVGNVVANFGGGSGWNPNTAGLMLETLDNTEIAVHDSYNRVASFMYYEGGTTNRMTIGRDMGWGGVGTVAINGNVGVGTNAPGVKLAVNGPGTNVYNTDAWIENNMHVQGNEVISQGGGRGRMRLGTAWGYVGLYAETSSAGAVNDLVLGAGSGTVRVGPGGGVAQSLIVPSGKVGVGTATPATALHVVGDITVTGNINAKYQDVAEWVPSTQKLQAGTVVVLDPERANHVLASSAPYDTAVAGVVSAHPGLTLGEAGEGKALVATTGRVKVKVDATRAAIKIGDLLVTGEAEGLAMKSEPLEVGGRRMHAPGTIIGKALEPLAGGKGEILVLLSLQ